MRESQINSNYNLLEQLVEKAIFNSNQVIMKKASLLGKSPEEPDYIAGLVLYFVPDFYQILKTLFKGYKFSVTGIYCHQKPIVDIGETKDPELGDILFIYKNTDKTGTSLYNSLLLQAKVSSKPISKVSSSDMHQLKLYSEWPEFKYKRSGIKLNGQLRNIQPKTINPGGQYLLIDNHPIYGLSGMKGTYSMGCANPNKELHLNQSLSKELIEFLKFKSGRPIEKLNVGKNDTWSQVIWEQLDISKLKGSKRNNIGLSKFPREVTKDFDGCVSFKTDGKSELFQLHNDLADSDNNGSNLNYIVENSGISLILIESNENE